MVQLSQEQIVARWPDDVEVYPASDQVLDGYRRAREQLTQFQAPLLVGEDKPHGRLFVACFDGTGNDKDKFPDAKTNVADIHDQIKAGNKLGLDSVRTSYKAGVGTQDDVRISELDGALGYSYGPRMEQMYYDFCVQAEKWQKQDPRAEISLATTGFSRGAVTAALFARMVEERGIQNPDGMRLERNADHQIVHVTPTQPNLVEPGRIPQIVGLFDPVATGVMNRVDVRLPPSVVSGFQITSINERRDEFRSKQIIDPGLSEDGRFLAVRTGGAHCDIGGSYRLNGLSVRNGNLMDAYLNATSDTPFLAERTVPTAPEMNVIHRSEQHRAIYTTLAADIAGDRRVIERLTQPASTVAGDLYDRVFSNVDDAEPRNDTLNGALRYRPVRVGPEREDPVLPEFFRDKPRLPEQAPSLNNWNQLFDNVPRAELDRDGGSRQGASLGAGLRGASVATATGAEPGDASAGLQRVGEGVAGAPRDALLDAVWARLPEGTSRERAEEVKLAAKIGGIERPDQLHSIVFKDDDPHAFVRGNTPGFRAAVDFSTAAPPLQTTRQSEELHDRRQARMWDQFAQQQARLNEDGPRMALGGRGAAGGAGDGGVAS